MSKYSVSVFIFYPSPPQNVHGNGIDNSLRVQSAFKFVYLLTTPLPPFKEGEWRCLRGLPAPYNGREVPSMH